MSPSIKFGDKATADRVRDRHDGHLCPDDDRRLKTVTFQSDTPESVIEDAEAAATTSRAEDDRPPIEAIELTETEKRDLDFSRDGVNVPKARYLKGLGQEYSVDPFQHVDLAEVDTVADARPILDRARKSGGTGRGGGTAQYDDEAEERERRERRQKAEKQQAQGCDHARDACEHGKPDACEFLTETCGYSRDEVEELLADIQAETPTEGDDTTQQELVTVGGDQYPEMDVTPAQAGALGRSWSGYKAAVGTLDTLLSDVEEEIVQARRAWQAINAIRETHGQDELHPDRLHDLLAWVDHLPGSLPETTTLQHFTDDGGQAADAGPSKFDTDHDTAAARFEDRADQGLPAIGDVGPFTLKSGWGRGDEDPALATATWTGLGKVVRVGTQVADVTKWRAWYADEVGTRVKDGTDILRSTRDPYEAVEAAEEWMREQVEQADAAPSKWDTDHDTAAGRLEDRAAGPGYPEPAAWELVELGRSYGTNPAPMPEWEANGTVLKLNSRGNTQYIVESRFPNAGVAGKSRVEFRSPDWWETLGAAVDLMHEYPQGLTPDFYESDVLEQDPQRDLSGRRTNPQTTLAGGETGERGQGEVEQQVEENPGGLLSDEREQSTATDDDAGHAIPDEFRVPEGGQGTLGDAGDGSGN